MIPGDGEQAWEMRKLEEIPSPPFLFSLRTNHTLSGVLDTMPHPGLLVLCSDSTLLVWEFELGKGEQSQNRAGR